MDKNPFVQFVMKMIRWAIALFLIFSLMFLVTLGAATTDNFNFCVNDEDASSSVFYKILQSTVFEPCTKPDSD